MRVPTDRPAGLLRLLYHQPDGRERELLDALANASEHSRDQSIHGPRVLPGEDWMPRHPVRRLSSPGCRSPRTGRRADKSASSRRGSGRDGEPARWCASLPGTPRAGRRSLGSEVVVLRVLLDDAAELGDEQEPLVALEGGGGARLVAVAKGHLGGAGLQRRAGLPWPGSWQ
jgi:hypothetical protein